ncbi:Hypothetical predicted protein, partial [Xyrichtys novacula]
GHVNSSSQQIPIRRSGASYRGETVTPERGRKPPTQTADSVKYIQTTALDCQTLQTEPVDSDKMDYGSQLAGITIWIRRFLSYLLCFWFTFESPF